MRKLVRARISTNKVSSMTNIDNTPMEGVARDQDGGETIRIYIVIDIMIDTV